MDLVVPRVAAFIASCGDIRDQRAPVKEIPDVHGLWHVERLSRKLFELLVLPSRMRSSHDIRAALDLLVTIAATSGRDGEEPPCLTMTMPRITLPEAVLYQVCQVLLWCVVSALDQQSTEIHVQLMKGTTAVAVVIEHNGSSEVEESLEPLTAWLGETGSLTRQQTRWGTESYRLTVGLPLGPASTDLHTSPPPVDRWRPAGDSHKTTGCDYG